MFETSNPVPALRVQCFFRDLRGLGFAISKCTCREGRDVKEVSRYWIKLRSMKL